MLADFSMLYLIRPLLLWQVDVALDGEQAVEMGTTGNYGVILM